MSPLSNHFQPTQLGFGTKGGCEAAIHSLRTYLTHNGGEVLLKVDIKNAFNSVDRGALLTQVKENTPTIFNFIWQCYYLPSKLLYKDNLLSSSVGCQQGDPLGPAIFSLSIHPILKKLSSKFNVWYLDDGTLGGEVHTVFDDLRVLIHELNLIGLELNFTKCELFISDNIIDKSAVCQIFNSLAPGIRIIDKSFLRLLGSPIFEESFPPLINEKILDFQTVSDCLVNLNTHTAYFIMRYCLFVPKFTYTLRCSPFWKHENLMCMLDNVIRETLTTILNINLDDRSWAQASLPIRYGGLGIRKISCVSLPAFLSSIYSTSDLIGSILTPSLGDFEVACLVEAKTAWSLACPSLNHPTHPSSQRQWDEPLSKLVHSSLIESSCTNAERARLLAVSKWESGLWLQAIPCANIGTFLDNTSFRIAACLRLGANVNAPHRCQCGDHVDRLGHHGLSCGRSAGRISRHAALNDIIRRALATAGVPATAEPSGLSRGDGRRPDGMSLVPWKMGRPLVWDATCVDTLAPSHLPDTSVMAGVAAAQQECLKRRKYEFLGSGYIFEAFGVETLGPWGPGAQHLFKEVSKRLVEASRDQRAGLYLAQRISIAIQRGNVASLLGTLPQSSDLGQVFYL